METSRSNAWRCPDSHSLRVVFGLVFLAPLIDFTRYYGNLSIYTDSYFIHKAGGKNSTSGSMWFMSLFTTTYRISIIAAGMLAKRYGPRPILVIGSLCFDAAVFVTFFTVQQSFWSMNITLAIFAGFFGGIIVGVAYMIAAAEFPDNVGFATSLVVSTYTGGSLIANTLLTFYINPQNKAPDMRAGTSTYFSDEDILSRVPFVFLVLGGVSTLCHVLAFYLLIIHSGVSVCGKVKTPLVKFTPQRGCDDLEFSHTSSERDINLIRESQIGNAKSEPDVIERQSKDSSSTDVQRELTTGQIIKTKMFYKVALLTVPLFLGADVVSNFYKQFGMLYINDDYFLTYVGVIITVAACVFTILSGFIVKTIGPQISFLLLSSLGAIMYAFLYFIPMLNKWLYLMWAPILSGIYSSQAVIIPIMIIHYFGRSNYVSNYGAALLSCCLFLVASPPALDAILTTFGYFWLFLFVSVVSFLSMCLVITLPITI